MYKWLLALFLVLSGILYWISEPLSINPFGNLSSPEIKVINEFECNEKKSNDAFYQQIMQAELLGGTAGVYSQECGLLATAFGYSDKRNVIDFEINTLTRIASIAKPMTAVAVMQLKEKGLIDINKTLSDYLSNVPTSHSNIKIKALLNHTSGVPHYSNKFEAMSFTNYESLQQVAEFIYKKELKFSSGEGYEYSSYGYSLLGRVIEVVSGQNFGEYMQENIWEPAGMRDTALELERVKDGKSRLYLNLAGWFVKSPNTDLSIIFPAGGIESTGKDVLLFGKAIMENRLIKRATLEEMIDVTQSKSHLVGDDPYGLGWSVYNHDKLGLILSHSGSQPGVSGFFQILLDQGVASVGLTNSFGSKSRVRQLAYDFAALAIENK